MGRLFSAADKTMTEAPSIPVNTPLFISLNYR
jgi:hypothetical protein